MILLWRESENQLIVNGKTEHRRGYYDEFYGQVIELVKIFNHNAVKWLDIGCGPGKMGSVAYENVEIMRNCGFRVVEILWLSNMQVGIWRIK